MTSPTTTPQDAAELAERLLHGPDPELERAVTILAHPEGSGPVERREALLPRYDAIVARVGPPTLLGGTGHGPSVRWHTAERTLLLAGDSSAATLSVHDAQGLARREFWDFDSGRPMPYTWQLDRGGPGKDPGWTFNGHSADYTWDEAEESLTLLLSSWAEHMPVQAPGDWVGFRLRISRDWKRDMVVGVSPTATGYEFHAGIYDLDHEQTPEHAEHMRARGWRELDEHRWWRVNIPETDPGAAAELSRVVISDVRARRSTCPAEVHAWDISAGDNGRLWVPGLGFEVHPRRGEHY
ncbi:hypothetical protein LG943_07780 [Streptomonospora sp. S1-112]|uniref:Uncharacterized protein n=1 Tax=Streptomonospora mangrovi TaxID=2883123 RepID=A0A9X3SCZ4_9ACTN|nr:hypothetical protein [Streptomonospora mangrovi]MDA0564223.1 hypothetical protein [Streptomonospora mangrovi]